MNELERIRGGEGSKFNSAIADLERQHNLLMACNHASSTGHYVEWCNVLNSLYREIVPYLSSKEKTALDEKRVKGIPTDKKAAHLFHDKLDKFETALRIIRATKKLGLIAEEDASTAALR